MKRQELTEIMDKKINQDRNKVVFSFYEVTVKYGLSKGEQKELLNNAKTRLENLGYSVYLEGDKYFYKGKFCELTPQEVLVAIK